MEKKTKMTVCSNCKTEMPANAKVCPSCGAKNRKPFYRKWWVILLAVIAVIAVISGMIGNREERFDWNEVILSERLPEPGSNVGEIIANDSEYLSLNVDHLSQRDYEAYVEECQTMGYTVDQEKDGSLFDAFDEEGYHVSVGFLGEAMSISLQAPMELGTLNWPKSDLASLLPLPEPTVGKVDADTTDYCIIYVGEMPIEQFNAYADRCADAGFAADYERGDKYYRADDQNGNHLSLSYEGNQIVRIELHKNDEAQAADDSGSASSGEAASDPAQRDEASENAALVDGMRPEFKEAMDSYEAFMNEYCDFMNKYAGSDGTDAGMLNDYANYIDRYAQMVQDFEAWEDDELNAAEEAYYVDVQARVSKRLIETEQLLADMGS